MTRFSIIIPVYSEQQEVDELLVKLSTAVGTFESYEILVIDDGSPQTIKISENLFSRSFHEKIRLIRQSNSGPGIARNLGVSLALGSYILFLDSDDCFSSGFLETLSEEIRGINSPEVLYFDFYHPDNNDSLIRRDHYAFKNISTLKFSTLNWECYQESMFAAYKREFLETNNLSFEEGFFEDILFQIKTVVALNDFVFLPKKLYKKNRTRSSITSTISRKHLIDYISVLETINTLYETGDIFSRDPEEPRINWLSAILSRVVWIQSLEIPMSVRNYWISEYIKQLDASKLKNWRSFSRLQEQIRTPFIIGFSKFSKIDPNIEKSIVEGMKSIEEILHSTWSCQDLQSSVYFAPSEVRTCCKRFFRNGKLAGDVVLNTSTRTRGELDDLHFVPLSEIHKAKRDLHRAINLGKKTDCEGCPFLEFKAWEPLSKKLEIKYLSMEQHSVCNLRCIYCDEKYYGGALPDYDVMKSISDCAANGALNSLSTVVWGGGEPTLDRNFDAMLNEILDIAPKCEHRFLTNGLRYSNTIARALSMGNSQVVTSIDSGDEQKYLEIRGRKGFSKVLKNLKSYQLQDKGTITIKYIFTSGNKDAASINSFVNEIKNYQLEGAFFQISWDFKEEKIQKTDFVSILQLFSGLYEIGAKLTFLDDLLFLRLAGEKKSHDDWSKLLCNAEIPETFLAKKEDFQEIILFGAGKQAAQVQEKLDILSRWPITKVVESIFTPDKEFFGMVVEPLTVIRESNAHVLILGVQSTPKMYNAVLDLGVRKERIVRKLLI